MTEVEARPQDVWGSVRVEPEVLRACPLCGDTRLRFWRRGYDRSHLISRQQFTYSRCRRCGLRFESVRPPESQISRFYPKTYYDPRTTEQGSPRHSSRPRGGAKRVLNWVNARADEHLPDPLPARLRSTYGRASEGKAFLDYGCGSAAFLDRMRKHGWRTIGVDVSVRVLQEVRANGHEALPAELDAWGELADASLGLARLNHVIEHLYRPREVLSALFRKLEPGGILHVSTPNPTSYASALLRSRWLGLDCPRHVLLYPPRLLASLLREIGFRRVDLFHEVLTKDLARSLGYVLHDLGRLHQADILAMAEREGLASALHAAALLTARTGASDRFHAFAEK